MSHYRDEREALRAKVGSLEQELEAAREEVDKLRGDGPAEERIERLAAELAAAETELHRLRGDAPPRTSMFFGGATGSIGVAVLATMWLFGSMLGSPCPEHRSGAFGREMENGADLPDRLSSCPRIAATGVVTDAVGVTDVEREATCDVAVIPFAGQCKVRVRCDGAWLFDGFAHVRADGRVVDEHPTIEDLDPRIDIDPRARHAEVSDETEHGSFTIEIDFSEEP
jgi:hypothetical protein